MQGYQQKSRLSTARRKRGIPPQTKVLLRQAKQSWQHQEVMFASLLRREADWRSGNLPSQGKADRRLLGAIISGAPTHSGAVRGAV